MDGLWEPVRLGLITSTLRSPWPFCRCAGAPRSAKIKVSQINVSHDAFPPIPPNDGRNIRHR